MDTLIITEKPEIGRLIAKSLDNLPPKQGGKGKAINSWEGDFKGTQILIISLQGSPMRLQKPEEIIPNLKWSTPELCLPIPTAPKLLPAAGCATLLKSIKTASRKAKEVIIATDTDIEGETIGQDVALYCGCVEKSKRLSLIESLEPDDIRKALRARTNLTDHRPKYRAGQFRREYDWYWMFLVRVQTANARKGLLSQGLNLKPDEKSVISSGRAQGVMLNIICTWHMDRKNFSPLTHYKVVATTDLGDMTYFPGIQLADDYRVVKSDSGQSYITSLSDVERMMKSLEGYNSIQVDQVVTKIIKEKPENPCDALSLQQLMSSVYKWPSSKTMKIAEKVRFKGYITYVRTDDSELPISMLTENKLTPLLDAAAMLGGMIDMVDTVKDSLFVKNRQPKCFTDAPLPHFGISPSSKKLEKNGLTHEEYLVYEMICRRFVMALMPDSRKRQTRIIASLPEKDVIDGPKCQFSTSFTEAIDLGWRAMKKASAESYVPSQLPQEGQHIGMGEIASSELHTEPRGSLRMGDLLAQLRRPSMICEDKEQLRKISEAKGIGTAATRHTIFEKIQKRPYALEDIDGHISPTGRGLAYYEGMPREIIGAELTASVETAMKEIMECETDDSALKIKSMHLANGHRFVTKHVKSNLDLYTGKGSQHD